MIQSPVVILNQIRRWNALCVSSVALSSIFVAVFLIGKSGPTIFGDELGYLSAGRVLAGEGAIYMGGGTTYHPAAGIIYSLAFRIFDSPEHIYSFALLLNVIQIGIAMILLSGVLVKLGISDREPLILVPLLWIFGGLLYYASFAMAEATVSLVFAGLLCSTAWYHLGENSKRQLLLVSFAQGFAWIVHPRFIIILAAFLISLFLFKTPKMLPLATIFSIVGLLVARFLTTRVTGPIYSKSLDNLTKPLKSVLDISIQGLVFGSVAKVVYLTISSFGFFLVGIYAIFKLGRELNFIKCYLLCSIGLVILYTSKSLSLESDPKFFFYGRYVEPLTGCVTLLGIVTLLRRPEMRSRITVNLPLIWVLLSGIFWLVFRSDGRSYQISNSPGFIFLAEISSRPGIYFSVLLFSVCLMLIYYVGRRHLVIVLTLVIGIAATGAIAQIRYSLSLAGMQPRHEEFISNARQIDGEWETMSVDRAGGTNTWGHIYGMQWWASEFDIQFHDGLKLSSERPPDVLIQGGSNAPLEYELIAADKWTNFTMWAVADRGAAAVLRDPKDLSADRLKGWLFGSFVRDGDGVRGEVSVENLGDAQWFPVGGAFGAVGGIRVVIRIHLDDEVIRTERIDLPGMMWPGQRELLTFEIQNLGDFDRITVEGVQEGVRWFSQVGIPPSELERIK